MTRRTNLEIETARQMFLAVREVMQHFATRGTVAQQSLVQRFYLNEEPPRSRNPGLEACFLALRAEPDFGARAIARHVRAEHEPQLPGLYTVSATINRIVEMVVNRLTGEGEPAAESGKESGIEAMDTGTVATGEVGMEESSGAGTGESQGTGVGEGVVSSREDRGSPCAATVSRSTAFELTTGTFEVPADSQAAESVQHQAALSQLIRLFGQSQAVQILERVCEDRAVCAASSGTRELYWLRRRVLIASVSQLA